jgi:Barstar (barnase inhibitor)
MSGLAGVLAGRRAPGVYRWASHARGADVAHAVEHAGWQFVRLDTVRVEDEAGLVQEVGATYGVDTSGAGLDGLGDLLAGVHHERGTVTLWEGWSPFARAEPSRFDVAVGAFTRRCGSAQGGAFVVLLRGDGPPVGLPDLDPHGRPQRA